MKNKQQGWCFLTGFREHQGQRNWLCVTVLELLMRREILHREEKEKHDGASKGAYGVFVASHSCTVGFL